MVSRFVAKQLSRPAGLAGWLTRTLMNRGNAALNGFALEQLALTPDDRVLEVGFGGGVLLPRLLDGAGFVCGVDRSPDVVSAAQGRFAPAIHAARVEFKVGAIESLPLPDASFDKALSVHTVYFWNSLAAGCAELARILRPGGRIVLGFLPKAHMDRMNMPPDVFTPRTPDDVLDALNGAGLSNPELRRSGQRNWAVATATKN